MDHSPHFSDSQRQRALSGARARAHPARRLRWGAFAALSGLAACTVMPTGPTVMALPGTGKTFDEFRADDFNCRQYAFGQVGGVSANDAATTSAVCSAALGTAVGAAAGAAFGGGRGAAIGAGAGLLTGGAIGTGAGLAGERHQLDLRYRYALLIAMLSEPMLVVQEKCSR